MNKNRYLRNFVALFAFFIGFSSLPSIARDAGPRILVMGDSLLAAHAITSRAISDSIEKTLNEKVVDRSIVGARSIYNLPLTGALGFRIASQYAPGNWDWVVLNGGGNDVWLGCGCSNCTRKINKLISKSGQSGSIPKLVAKIRKSGARVVYVGYLRSPGTGSPIESCKDEGDELESRISTMSTLDKGIFFLSLQDLVPHGDRSFHAVDMIHPSLKASRVIGRLAADIIRRNDPK